MKKDIAMLWSGGKDSAFALYKLLQSPEYRVKFLITTINRNFKRVSIHGIREELIEEQARKLNIPLVKVYVKQGTNKEYEEKMLEASYKLKQEYNIDYLATGDIFLEDLREYREKTYRKIGVRLLCPLWKQDTRKLAEEFIEKGFKTVICSLSDNKLPESFLGKIFDKNFLESLPEEVDPCGENGEFHSFCYEAPMFSEPIPVVTGEKVYKPVNIKLKCPVNSEKRIELPKGIWYVDVLLRA